MLPSLSLPPLECCFGTSPIQAEKFRPDRKAFGSATLATRAVASAGPTPGISSSRLLASLDRCQAMIWRSKLRICTSSSSTSSTSGRRASIRRQGVRAPYDKREGHMPRAEGSRPRPPAEILEWRFHSALFLTCDARLLQIELALDAPACLIRNFALSQQLVDVLALGGNQADLSSAAAEAVSAPFDGFLGSRPTRS